MEFQRRGNEWHESMVRIFGGSCIHVVLLLHNNSKISQTYHILHHSLPYEKKIKLDSVISENRTRDLLISSPLSNYVPHYRETACTKRPQKER